MSNITCNNCGFDENPQGTEYCEACGCELTVTSPFSTSVENDYNPPPQETMMPPSTPPSMVEEPQMIPSTPSSFSSPSIMGSAKLVAKRSDVPQLEFELSSSEHSIVGRFDDTTGPVDVDLGDFPDGDTISRNQAEIYFEGSQWKIKPISTTNGTFIKKAGETRFGSPLNAPEVLNNGDEIAFAKLRFIFQTF